MIEEKFIIYLAFLFNIPLMIFYIWNAIEINQKKWEADYTPTFTSTDLESAREDDRILKNESLKK